MTHITNATRTISAVALTGFLGLMAAAPAVAAPLPSYATGSTDETVHGTIASVNGPYNITVRDDRGFIDNVSLHQGTIINPTGLTLAPGQRVTILGSAQGGTLAANEIDTPYRTVGFVPVYPYGYGYGYGYPYRHAYPYGPEFGARVYFGHGFGFGFRG